MAPALATAVSDEHTIGSIVVTILVNQTQCLCQGKNVETAFRACSEIAVSCIQSGFHLHYYTDYQRSTTDIIVYLEWIYLDINIILPPKQL